MPQVILKRFEAPDEVISFEKGRFEKIGLGGVTIGRAVYEPGWKWSTHVGSKTGATLCQVEHVGRGQRTGYRSDAKRMRIFVAGVSGAIGRPLIMALVNQGHQVTGMTRSESAAQKLTETGAAVALVSAFDASAGGILWQVDIHSEY
jgi:hypothetical protein